jgi:hypothetical protein
LAVLAVEGAMAEDAHGEHPPPPHHGAPVEEPAKEETSERIFKRRLIKALMHLNFRDLRAMQKEELFEPHMHLFLMLVSAFALGVLIYVFQVTLM